MNPRLFSLIPILLSAPPAGATDLTINTSAGKAISPDLVGIFFEDLNYAADGGLYAELVQNRSFEYSPTDQPSWGPFTAWEFVRRGGGAGEYWIDSSGPIHPNNPHSVLVSVDNPGGGTGLVNGGYDGIPVESGKSYDFSIFTRLIHAGPRHHSSPDGKLALAVRLETPDGTVIAESSVEASSPSVWKQLATTLVPNRSAPDARLAVLLRSPGQIALDEVSLFPHHTFKGHKNGLRADLAQTIADIHPKFMRFPGGCLAHGDGLSNIYRWKDTVGPVEKRKGQTNIWRYHQSVGLGYFEYFQFCEDIGAKPLPVLAAGVSCQNSSRSHGTGQQAVPMAEMPAYIQDILDLVEWANGPATSRWGSVRAAAGHPKPFGLKYLGIGNEDHMTPEFRERFTMIFQALKKAHPEISVVGTVGPSPAGFDFTEGWKTANTLGVPTVDEHYYMAPNWFWNNLHRYDGYDRTKSKVYVGEYAARDARSRSTLRSALAEAACLTSLEKNGDVVRFASYAPLLARHGHTQWTPDLIYFNGTRVFPTINYQVQRLFGENSGNFSLPVTSGESRDLAASAVRDSASGDLILKIVNGADSPASLRIVLNGPGIPPVTAIRTVLTAPNQDAVNEDGAPPAAKPESSTLRAGREFPCEIPASSLTVLRLKAK